MKKILLTLFGIFFLYQVSFAALAATTVWEVRTTGNSANGAGFNASRDAVNGVDYSQQDTAQLSLTDLAMTTGGTTLTSTTGGFTHAMEGNLIYIASGTNFTAGYYEIVTYTNTNTVTLDRDATAGSNGSSGSGKVGGASNHPNTISLSLVTDNIVYIASGTYIKVGANAYVLSCPAVMVSYIGYTGSRATAFGTNRPLFDGGGNTTNCLLSQGANYRNLRFANATGDNVVMTDGSVFFNCKSSSAGGDGFDSANTAGRGWYDCEVNNNGGWGIRGTNNPPNLQFCYIHDNTSGGEMTDRGDTNPSHLYNVFESNSGNGCQGIGNNGPSGHFIGNIAYNNTGGSTDGFVFSGNQNDGLVVIRNNISMNNGRYGFNYDGSVTLKERFLIFDYNLYYGNGTAGLYQITAGAHDLTSDPLFTAPTANPPDFTLQAGSPCLNAGFPDSSWAANVGLASGNY